jgi:hypothetical protein
VVLLRAADDHAVGDELAVADGGADRRDPLALAGVRVVSDDPVVDGGAGDHEPGERDRCVARTVAVSLRLPAHGARLRVEGEHAARPGVEVVGGDVEPAVGVGGHRGKAVALAAQRPQLRTRRRVERDQTLRVVAGGVDAAAADRRRKVDLGADEALPAQRARRGVEGIDPAAVPLSPAGTEVHGAVDHGRSRVRQPIAGGVAPDRGARGRVERVEDTAVAAADIDLSARDGGRRPERGAGRERPQRPPVIEIEREEAACVAGEEEAAARDRRRGEHDPVGQVDAPAAGQRACGELLAGEAGAGRVVLELRPAGRDRGCERLELERDGLVTVDDDPLRRALEAGRLRTDRVLALGELERERALGVRIGRPQRRALDANPRAGDRRPARAHGAGEDVDRGEVEREVADELLARRDRDLRAHRSMAVLRDLDRLRALADRQLVEAGLGIAGGLGAERRNSHTGGDWAARPAHGPAQRPGEACGGDGPEGVDDARAVVVVRQLAHVRLLARGRGEELADRVHAQVRSGG